MHRVCRISYRGLEAPWTFPNPRTRKFGGSSHRSKEVPEGLAEALTFLRIVALRSDVTSYRPKETYEGLSGLLTVPRLRTKVGGTCDRPKALPEGLGMSSDRPNSIQEGPQVL